MTEVDPRASQLCWLFDSFPPQSTCYGTVAQSTGRCALLPAATKRRNSSRERTRPSDRRNRLPALSPNLKASSPQHPVRGTRASPQQRSEKGASAQDDPRTPLSSHQACRRRLRFSTPGSAPSPKDAHFACCCRRSGPSPGGDGGTNR